MLPSARRLTTPLFTGIMKTGRLVHTPFFLARIKSEPTAPKSRFAISVPKKIASTAVERNKLRRRVYSAIADILKDKLFSDGLSKKPLHVVLIAKIEMKKAKLPEIQADLGALFKKLVF